jgi:hypothetical protein
VPAIVPGQRRSYRPLDQLPSLLDPCHYTIFSDQDGWIYEGTPRTGVELRPIESH